MDCYSNSTSTAVDMSVRIWPRGDTASSHTTVAHVILGDLLHQNTDAIVNSTDENLSGIFGLDLAIHKVAGSRLGDACRALSEQRHGIKYDQGDVVITDSYDLSTRGIRHIVHTIGVPYNYDDHELSQATLLSVILNILAEAKANHIRSISLPILFSGALGYPEAISVRGSVEAIQSFCDANPDALDEIRLVINDTGLFTDAVEAIQGLLIDGPSDNTGLSSSSDAIMTALNSIADRAEAVRLPTESRDIENAEVSESIDVESTDVVPSSVGTLAEARHDVISDVTDMLVASNVSEEVRGEAVAMAAQAPSTVSAATTESAAPMSDDSTADTTAVEDDTAPRNPLQ